jgi:hypothetical protein
MLNIRQRFVRVSKRKILSYFYPMEPDKNILPYEPSHEPPTGGTHTNMINIHREFPEKMTGTIEIKIINI